MFVRIKVNSSFFYYVVYTGLRLMGIGRNQYIDLMNATKSSRGVAVRKNINFYLLLFFL